jgi:hypothetical protein
MTFSTKIKDQLPPLLADIVKKSISPEDADMLILGTLTAISACLPNLYGIYDGRKVRSNLYLFVSAKASTGKGRLALCKQIVRPVHKELRDAYYAEVESIKQAIIAKGKNPDNIEIKVPQRALYIPANASSTALYQTLHDSYGQGLIFETEGDTLSCALKTDYGNFSDGLRKAFHHEGISYVRRKEKEWVEIEHPQLSVVLAGTPNQVKNLIPDTENGLFSRFIILQMGMNVEWKDVFSESNNEESDDDIFSAFGDRFYEMYKLLRLQGAPLRFKLTQEQQQQFNARFKYLQETTLAKEGDEFIATVRRMGLITYRLAMLISFLGYEGKPFVFPNSQIVCSDCNFNIAMTIMESLVQHALDLYHEMPESEEATQQLSIKEQQKGKMMQMLPQHFSREEAIRLSSTLKIAPRTVDKYLRELVNEKKINNAEYGSYNKTTPAE